jgi:hypothetical protein
LLATDVKLMQQILNPGIEKIPCLLPKKLEAG